MTPGGPGHDIRTTFEEQLEDIHRGIAGMGSLVLENAGRATHALLGNDLELAREAISADAAVDEAYIALERKVFEIIARQQPVARDLRFLVAITRLLYEIERSGDLVVNICSGLLRHEGYDLTERIHEVIAQTSKLVTELFAKSLDVLSDLDGSGFEWLDRLDDHVDDHVGELYTLIGRSSDQLGFEVAVELSRTGRYLERIADHGVNIGEHVAFVVTGTFPDHHEESVATLDED
jgi:phosphate transport system protein